MVNNLSKSTSSGRLQNDQRTFQYKLVLLGESAVGKSSLVLRFVKNVFSTNQESTIGAAFLTQTLHVDGDTLKFEIWDTAGQERYHSLAPMYYRGANAAVIVYDISSVESFERAKKWVTELQKQAQPDIVIALVGNKTDLQTQRKVQKQEALDYAQDKNLIVMEASAKSGDNVIEIFDAIALRLPKTEPHLATTGRSFSASTSGARKIDLGRGTGGNGSSGGFMGKSSCC